MRVPTSIKTLLIIIGLALLACLVVLVLVMRKSRPNEPDLMASVSDASRGPSFEVRVVMPRLGLPLAGILPDALAKKLDATPSEMAFDHTSPGAQVGSVDNDSLELSAEGWDLSIETDAEGRIISGTRLLFQLPLGGRQVRLDCRPANPAIGYLRTTTRAGSAPLNGRFQLQLATCKNVDSGKTTNWPPAPLTLNGSFAGLPQQRR